MRLAVRDDNVKAIVIRIDSPGGSALASEVMWQAVRRAAAKKPVIISVGGMAASGGYYLACAGDKIFADPTAIVGSIGVVGGKFVFKDLFEKLGLHTETFAKGSNAGLFSSSEPWTDRQRHDGHQLDEADLRAVHRAGDDDARGARSRTSTPSPAAGSSWPSRPRNWAWSTRSAASTPP